MILSGWQASHHLSGSLECTYILRRPFYFCKWLVQGSGSYSGKKNVASHEVYFSVSTEDVKTNYMEAGWFGESKNHRGIRDSEW